LRTTKAAHRKNMTIPEKILETPGPPSSPPIMRRLSPRTMNAITEQARNKTRAKVISAVGNFPTKKDSPYLAQW